MMMIFIVVVFQDYTGGVASFVRALVQSFGCEPREPPSILKNKLLAARGPYDH